MRVNQVTLLHEYVERSSDRRAGDTALVCDDRRLTWGEIDGLSARAACILQEAGVERGDRVVIYMDNSVEACISVTAILRLGAVFCVVNPQTKADKLAYVLNDCRAKAIITDVHLTRVYREVLTRTPHLTHAFVATNAPNDLPQQIGYAAIQGFETAVATVETHVLDCPAIPLDLAAIIYTSGTTAEPKGVMLSHLNMVSAVESVTTYLHNQPGDVVLNLLPMSFDYGLYQWLMVGQFGGTLVLERSFNYPARVLERATQENVTGLPVVPMIVSLLKPLAEQGLRLPRVRYATNTAAVLSSTHVNVLQQLLPNAQLFSMYGLTECQRVSYLAPEQIAIRPTSVGKAMPNTEAFVVDANDRRVGPNTVGELVVRGPHVMQGYWEKPAATAERLRPGAVGHEHFLYTGDYFRTDEEGYLYFVARKDDIIKSRGEKVSPKEVEDALHTLPGVRDAVVIGVPDQLFGQAIHAYLVLEAAADYTPRQVIAHCVQHLETAMVPKYVTFLSSLPTTSSNKVTRKHLAQWAEHARVGGDCPL